MLFKQPGPSATKGLFLLRKRAKKALKGVGRHTAGRCPIACAYGIKAKPFWMWLSLTARKVMKNAGWNNYIYDNFVVWYDDYDFACRSKMAFLRRFLVANNTKALALLKIQS